MYKTLTEFINLLEREGELVRVSAPVSAELEIAEITDRESKREGGGRALLFENSGTHFPVLTNMMGSDRRIALALGVERLDELTERIEGLFKELTSPKVGWLDRVKMLPLLGEISRWMPQQKSGRGACQEVIYRGDEVDLGMLPILKCWPFDGGRFVTLPLVNTLDPESGARNVGMYRMQCFDAQTTGLHWHLHKTGERHYQGYKRLGERMPVAVCLGGDPAYTYAATAPMPDNLDEYLLAGFIRRRSVELVECVSCGLRVPADCDFVIEGYVDPTEERVVEGPFGDHTGYYSLEDNYPKFHITAITHRRGAIYPATLVGIPPQEDAYIAKATEKIFLAPIRMAMLPEMEDLYMPVEGVAHNLAIANIGVSYPAQGLKVGSSLWGAGQMMFNKFLVVTANDRPIRELETLRALILRADPESVVSLGRGPLDVLDHASDQMGVGGKMLIDLTQVDLERTPRPVTLPPKPLVAAPLTRIDTSLVQSWGGVMITVERTKLKSGAESEVPSIEELIASATASLGSLSQQGVRWVLLLDQVLDTKSLSDVVWFTLGNCDPQRDTRLVGGVLYVDGRIKAGGVNGFGRRWPQVPTTSAEMIEQVDRRWEEYELGAFQSSPSLRYIALQPNPLGASWDEAFEGLASVK